MKLAKGSATRKQLVEWLARAIRHVPPNLCELKPPYSCPPQWCKDAVKELERNGITFTPPLFHDDD